MRGHKLYATFAVALIVGGIFSTPISKRISNFSLDSLFWMRHVIWGPQNDPDESNVVVVAIDEETYRTEPFRNIPKVMWTKQIGQVIDSLNDAGATTIGFDLIFPTSVESIARGYDRSFMLSLRRAAKERKIVLAKVTHQLKSISPFSGHSFAVGHQRNIRSVNLYDDEDGIIRRVPLYFDAKGGGEDMSLEPSFSLEIASRITGDNLRIDPNNGDKFIGGYNIPGGKSNALTINFDGGASIPTFSLSDIYACIQHTDTDFIDKHFKNKGVLLGVVLDVEDRKLTSKRFITAPDRKNNRSRCTSPALEDLYNDNFIRDSIPGVYIHAAAINNFIRQDGLHLLSPYWNGIVIFIFSLLIAYITMRWMSFTASIIGVSAAILGICISVLMFWYGFVVPLFTPLISGLLTFVVLMSYRVTVTDKDKRKLKQGFSLYVAPSVVDRMLDNNELPKLGGEQRELTVLFSDIENYTKISEDLSPEELVEGLNKYFSEMSTVIEEYGGIIDKYIGDAIVAIFGAPLSNAEHARMAVEAALTCQERLSYMKAVFPRKPDYNIRARIGINTGSMLVGNIGSKQHFNYTVMGDAVNVAARLESANKYIGSSILVSESTAKVSDRNIIYREVDLVRVMGRNKPIVVYQPMGKRQNGIHSDRNELSVFSSALKEYQAGRFDEALSIISNLSPSDPVVNRLAERTRDMIKNPPEGVWEGIFDLKTK